MASEGGSALPGRDPAWKYCLPIEGNRNGTICNFCGLVMKSGGITRFKFHLMQKDPHNNTKKCSRVPPEVKEEIRFLVHDKTKAKAKKNADIEEIRAQLHMHPDERDAYRYAVRASKASEWEREQYENIVGSKRKMGESSQSTGLPSMMRKSHSMRHSQQSPPIAPSLYKSSAAKQKNIKDIFKGGAIKETMGRLISKFFIYESVAPAKAKSHHFKNMIIGAQQAGMGIEPPSPFDIKNKYLEMEYREMEAYVNQQREKWKTYGCTIMSDGWTGPTKLSIINFMVYSKGSTVFLKSVDASNYIKDHKYIYDLLKTVIKEVGKENVVQIVTDNGLAFMKAGKQLMKKYNLYWTPCAAHCIDLIFEDIGKIPSVIEVINNALKITNFIYNHGWLLAQMRLYCGGDIVRPGATRMTNIVSLYEPLYVVLRLMDSEVVPTMPFVYELMHVMKTNLTRQGAGDWMFKIIQDHWEKTLKHPLHAATYFLNPRFQYRRGVGSDPELLQAVHDVFAKLDPTTESLGQFGNEMQKKDSVIERQLQQAEWWFMYGNQTPTLRKLAIKVLSQTASSTACERNWSTFALIHTKQRNRLAYSRLEQLVFCYYNMRLKLRDMEAENDRVAEKDYLDLLDISAEVGEEEDNQLFQWVRPIHLDDELEIPIHELLLMLENLELMLNVCCLKKFTLKVLAKILMIPTKRLTPQVLAIVVDLVLQVLLLLVTMVQEVELMMEDEDHGSRRAGPGIGAIGKPYRGRERMMEPYNEELLSGSFESMSIGTQFSDSSNEANVYPPHVMSYGQPSSSTDEEYGMSRYSPSRQMSYQVPYQMEGGLGINTWVNFEYPIHVEAVGRTQEIYAWHVRIFNQYYRGSLSWYQYCLQQQDDVPSSINPIEPHRSSFWY
ncbi:hypothetical protein CK203_029672 [Vitis vinifera]|uniref:BED-type domain-containing protein n=1 Tax=Vitis vinifera TaxID=29760 RepID=A0A438IIB1_VITVI|nr:hypothetical protein CK203_029672 [Vitis vinifera]